MRSISAPTLAAFDLGRHIRRSLVRFDLDPADGGPVGLWDDLYDVTLSGVTYHRAAGSFRISDVVSAGDYAVRSLDVTLSALDHGQLAQIRATNWHQRPVTIFIAIAAIETPDAFDVVPWFSGHADRAVEKARANGTWDFVVNCESANRELGRKALRFRSDADQRQIDSTDGFFRHVTQTIQEDLLWGRTQKTPPSNGKRSSGLFGT